MALGLESSDFLEISREERLNELEALVQAVRTALAETPGTVRQMSTLWGPTLDEIEEAIGLARVGRELPQAKAVLSRTREAAGIVVVQLLLMLARNICIHEFYEADGSDVAIQSFSDNLRTRLEEDNLLF
ncbi:MAG: hypothetical protein WC777_04560 [Candidatus Gracilibacteria bacterium]